MLEITLKFDPASGIDKMNLKMLADALSDFTFVSEATHVPLPPNNQDAYLEGIVARSTAAAAPSQTAPVAASGSSAPPAPAPPAAPLGNTQVQAVVEFDSSGLAHDPRIHASTKSKTNDGRWTKRRGVPDAHYAAIETELRNLHQSGAQMPPFGAASTPAAPPPANAAPPVPPAPPVNPVPAPPQPDARAPLPPGTAASVNPFVGIVTRTTGMVNAGKITMDQVAEYLGMLGNPAVTKLTDLAAHHELIPTLGAFLDAHS